MTDRANSRVLITGGAGFIGCNLVDRLVRDGHAVTVFDDLSRRGAGANLEWLRQEHGNAFHFIPGDVRDFDALVAAADGAQIIYHLAAQVAVTTSVADPRADFETNALGTFNLLEAARKVADNSIVIFASTNKVYGQMEDVGIVERDSRYAYRDLIRGLPESHPLDFHSPYGCSKGAADQYVHDYARIYGLRTVVFRQSCIYGPHQMGVEDQGWVAWFAIAALTGKPITIYGDGKQVRDILHVDDLLEAYQAAIRSIDIAAGQVYNMGGGPEFTMSVWAEFGPMLEDLLGREIPVKRGPWRPGDQLVYVSDIGKAKQELGWAPRIGVREGLIQLVNWVKANRHLFQPGESNV